jgi:hypothetical protein
MAHFNLGKRIEQSRGVIDSDLKREVEAHGTLCPVGRRKRVMVKISEIEELASLLRSDLRLRNDSGPDDERCKRTVSGFSSS